MALNFPAKIYQILENESADIIRWQPNGMAFRIVDHSRFEREIIPKYFRHNQLSSVQRQLNLYGFKCVSRGEDKGAFFHPKFKRGDWEIVKRLTRYVPTKSGNGKPGEETETDTTPVVVSAPTLTFSAPSAAASSSVGKSADNAVKVADSSVNNVAASSVSVATRTPTMNSIFVEPQRADPFLQPLPAHHRHRPITTFSPGYAHGGHHLHHHHAASAHKAMYAVDPFSYIENNAYHPMADPLDYWHQWHTAAPMQTHGHEHYHTANYPTMKSVCMETNTFPNFAVDVQARSSMAEVSKKAQLMPVVEPVQKSSTIAVETKSEAVGEEKTAESKPYVFTVKNTVTIDPDFDLEDDFSLFHPDLDHHFAMESLHKAAGVDHQNLHTTKPQTRDAAVNTDLTQSATSFYAMYHLYPQVQH